MVSDDKVFDLMGWKFVLPLPPSSPTQDWGTFSCSAAHSDRRMPIGGQAKWAVCPKREEKSRKRSGDAKWRTCDAKVRPGDGWGVGCPELAGGAWYLHEKQNLNGVCTSASLQQVPALSWVYSATMRRESRKAPCTDFKGSKVRYLYSTGLLSTDIQLWITMTWVNVNLHRHPAGKRTRRRQVVLGWGFGGLSKVKVLFFCYCLFIFLINRHDPNFCSL